MESDNIYKDQHVWLNESVHLIEELCTEANGYYQAKTYYGAVYGG